MKILVVEDDRPVAETLQLLFSSYNYAVDIAADGKAGLEMAEAFAYDLILLDVLLPKLDGISLCQHLRAEGFQSPILLLTGQGGGQQKAIALNAGADDYVVKPFDAEELVARVQALLRRGRSTSQPILTWGNLSLDPNSRKVTYGTHLLVLTPKEYAILELFLRHPQTVFSARAILDHGWAATESPGEEAVRVHIKELRQKFQGVGAPKDLIKTVHRVGYRLNSVYSSSVIAPNEPQLTTSQIAELQSVNAELRVALEQLRSTQAELSQKNQELKIAYQTMEQERQQLQTAREELENRVVEGTAELGTVNQSLQQQHDQWQALFDHALDAIAVTDDNGCYVDANPATCELFGVSREELLRSCVADFADPEVNITPVWQQFLQQGQMSGEITLYRPDGTTREAEFNAIANFIPGRHLSILRDISDRKRSEAERKQAETALRESERRLSILMNNLPGYVYRVANDPNYTAEFISEGVFRITGYPQEDYLINRNISRGQKIHPDDADRVWNLVQQAVTTHQPYECEYRIITQAGSQKWVWERGQGIYGADSTLCFLEGFVTDFTDRKRAEEALRESEQQYRQILDSIADMVFVKQPGSRLVWANQAFRDYYGMTLEALQGIVDAPFNEPDYTLQYIQDDASVFATGQTLEISEEPVTRHDGVVHLFSTIKAPVYDKNGQVVMLVGVSRDITDQKQAEAKLCQRQELLSSIYEGADQGIFVIDVDEVNSFHYISFNRIAEQFAGASTQELQGKTPEEAFGPVIGAAFRQNYDRCLQTGTSISYEEHVLFEDRTLWTLTSLSPLRNEQGEIYRIVGTAIDITDRKQAEQKIREQAALLDIASDAIYVRDLDHQVLYWNRGAEQLYGWSATEAIGQKATDLLQESTAGIVPILQHLHERGEWQGEIHKTTRTGKGVIVEAHWTLVRDELGQPRSILCVSTNVTEKKQLEAQFYQAQRLESLGTLASGIAHDLNNVLTPILAIAQLLRLKPLNLDERSQEMLRVLEDSAKRGANMIKQILTFTRGTSEKRIPLQVAPLLLEVVQVAQQTFPKEIAIRANIPDQFFGSVSADPTHLYQVFMNLCVNARDAMPDGGTLTLSLENCFVDETLAQMNLNAEVGNYVLITIADTGTGISAELRDRIFEPFFTTKEPGKGTGLGLSTVLGIVKDYGGFVQVSSKVGHGSQFKVYLPTIEGTTKETVQSEELLQGNGELVLIVDDDIAVQQASRSLLEHHQYTTLVASDGIEATALYAKYQDEIKVVLIDVMMPNMDGVTTVRILQRINPNVKIIAMSGLSANRDPILAAGASVFLLKPYTLEDLLQSLHDLSG